MGMKILAWILLFVAGIKWFANIESAITEKTDETQASKNFWYAMAQIPAIIFFIIYLFA